MKRLKPNHMMGTLAQSSLSEQYQHQVSSQSGGLKQPGDAPSVDQLTLKII
jgi:hypothetical protein